MSAIEMMLDELELTAREASIYVSLLENGRADLRTVAKRADLRRAEAMAALERLVEKDVVHRSLHGERVEYAARDPLELKFMLKKRNFLSLLFSSGCLA
jgi:sugar-specific transcriptional regulator TrmB